MVFVTNLHNGIANELKCMDYQNKSSPHKPSELHNQLYQMYVTFMGLIISKKTIFKQNLKY